MKNKHIYFFIGTTAEFIKLAPIIRELKIRKIKFKLIASGQTALFENLQGYLGKIDVHLAFPQKSKKSSMLLFILWAIKAFFFGFSTLHGEFKGLHKQNSYFFIHGDTISSLIGTLIAKIYGLKIVHIESGLRSFHFLEPFPEEICRYIIIHLADILCAPTAWALKNLDGLPGQKILTGENTLIESHNWAVRQKWNKQIIKGLGKYYLLTMHRQEHVLFKKQWMIDTIKDIIKTTPKNLSCILITHHLTESILKNIDLHKITNAKVAVFPRFPYVDIINLMGHAEFMATDGCTHQEEAYYLGLPLIALRNRTERIEGLGENIVIAKSKKSIINNFLKNYRKYRRGIVGLGKRPAKIIVDYLSRESSTN